MSPSSFDLSRRRVVLGGLGVAGVAVAPTLAWAQGRAETLLVVQELGPNSLDMQGVGSNQTVNGLSWNCYDRLLSYASKTLPDGTLSYDREKLAPAPSSFARTPNSTTARRSPPKTSNGHSIAR
jgi:peptide/nickel transport system substrate-binding protein